MHQVSMLTAKLGTRCRITTTALCFPRDRPLIESDKSESQTRDLLSTRLRRPIPVRTGSFVSTKSRTLTTSVVITSMLLPLSAARRRRSPPRRGAPECFAWIKRVGCFFTDSYLREADRSQIKKDMARVLLYIWTKVSLECISISCFEENYTRLFRVNVDHFHY